MNIAIKQDHLEWWYAQCTGDNGTVYYLHSKGFWTPHRTDECLWTDRYFIEHLLNELNGDFELIGAL